MIWRKRLLLALSIAAVIGGFIFSTRFVYGVLGAQDTAWVVTTDAPKDTMKTLQRRFSADQRYFDMQVEDGALRLVADERYDDLLRARLAWDGGIVARRVDRTFDLPEPPTPDITVLPADANGGRRWRGSMDAIYTAFDAIEEDGSHAVLLFRVRGYGGSAIYETIACDREPAWRVAGTPAADATPENKEKFEAYPTKDGRGLFMMLPTVAAAELAKLDKSERWALTAGPSTLGTAWAAEDRGLIVQLGDDIGAYEFAWRNFMRLSGGGLPKGLPVEATPLPVDVGLVVLHTAMPLLIAVFWFAVARRLDRAAPEPWWVVLMTGGVALAINPLVLWIRQPIESIDWLDPHITDRAGRLEGFPDTLLAYTLHAGVPEELIKLLPVLVVARFTKAFDEPIDGILYCTASAVGFSCIEEYGYLFYGRMHASLLVLRATSTPPAHIFFTAITGYALGQGIGKGWRAVPIAILGFLGSVVVHGLYDAIISFSALQTVSRVYLVLLLVLFTFLVRRALRGSKGKVAPTPGATVVRVGSFIGMTLTTAVVGLGTLLLRELALRSSPESTYATGTTITFLILLSIAIGGASYALVATVPIDAVVDAVGITYSGVTYRWDEITGIAYRDRRGRLGRFSAVLVRLPGDREITIGPLRERAAVAMYVAIDVHRPHAPLPG